MNAVVLLVCVALLELAARCLTEADFRPRLHHVVGLALLRPAPISPESKVKIKVAETLDANGHDKITAAVGNVAAVRGKVRNVGRTRSGSIHFINFQGNPRGQFVGIVKAENLDAVVETLGGDINSALTGKNVELRGEIILNKGIPEIIVRQGSQIHIMTEPPPSAKVPQRGSPKWQRLVSRRLGIIDEAGHGPDIGSREWLSAVDRKSGVTDAEGHGPDPGSDEWQRAVDYKVFGRR